jgi:ComF family protein
MTGPALREAVLDWLYPRRCGLCGRLGDQIICPICRDEFVPVEEPARPGPMHSPLDAIYSIWAYEGRAGQAVRRLKYTRIVALADAMAADMRRAYDDHGLEAFDLVIPVPIHPSRARVRGFNQSDLLASLLPQGKVRPNLLRRIKKTKPQVELTAAKRVIALRGAFAAEESLAGKSILLIDDVVTTAGTALACAETLAAGGASRIALLAYCGERPLSSK